MTIELSGGPALRRSAAPLVGFGSLVAFLAIIEIVIRIG